MPTTESNRRDLPITGSGSLWWRSGAAQRTARRPYRSGRGPLFALALALLAPSLQGYAAQELITFSAAKAGEWKIYVKAKGVTPRPVLAARGDQAGGAIGPAGERVLMLLNRRMLIVVNAAGGQLGEVDLGKGEHAHPAWLSEEEVVVTAYSADSSGETSRLLRVNLSSGEIGPLVRQTGILDFPSLSPDGRMLAYTAAQTVSLHRAGVSVVQQLWLLDMFTGRARQLLLNDAQNIHADWSPDGSKLAFASNEGGAFAIWVADADGSTRRQLTKGPGAKTWPRWSPDGKTVLFSLAKGGSQTLWMIDSDGSNLRPFLPFGADADVELRDADWR